jgi:hypothetical protein
MMRDILTTQVSSLELGWWAWATPRKAKMAA